MDRKARAISALVFAAAYTLVGGLVLSFWTEAPDRPIAGLLFIPGIAIGAWFLSPLAGLATWIGALAVAGSTLLPPPPGTSWIEALQRLAAFAATSGALLALTVLVRRLRARLTAQDLVARDLARELEAAFTSIQDGLIVFDASGGIRRMNPAAEWIFDLAGLDRTADVTTRAAAAVLETPSGRPLPVAEFPSVRALLGEVIRGEILVLRAGEQRIWISVNAAPLAGPDGQPNGAVMHCTNVSETYELQRERERLLHDAQHKAEEAEEGRRILEALLEHIPVGIVIAEASTGEVRFLSRHAETIAGRTRDQLIASPIGRQAAEWGLYTAGGREPALNDDLPLQRALRDGAASRNQELVVQRPDGRAVPILATAAPIRDRDRRITGAICAFVDISERKVMEEELRGSEERFRTLAETLPQMVWAALPDGRTDYFNNRWFEYTGQSWFQPLGWGWLGAVHPDDTTRAIAAWQQAIDNDRDFETEYRLRRANGEYRWQIARGFPLRDPEGRITRWFGTCTDIHDRRSVEEQLRLSEQRLMLALEAARVGIWDRDIAGEVIEWSARAREIYGFTPDEPLTLGRIWDRIHPEDRDPVRALLQQAYSGPGEYHAEFRLLLADGAVRWVDERGRVQFEHEGHVRRPVRMLGTMVDVTERRLHDEALRHSQALLEESQRIAHVGTFEIDPETRLVTRSDEAFRICGREPGDLGPELEVLRTHVPSEDQPRVFEAIEGCLAGGQPFALRHRVVLPDGSRRIVFCQGHLERDEDGRPVRLIGTMQDVTEQVLADEQRRRLELRLQRADKLESLSLLAGGVAHDFNNLLMGVMGNAEMALLDLPDGAPMRPLLENVQIAAQRAAELAGQMLAYSGRGRTSVSWIDLNETIRDSERLLRARVSNQVVIRLDLAGKVPSIEADVTQMRQILLNLVTNAAEAIGARGGHVDITTAVRRVGPGRGEVDAPDGAPLAAGEYVVMTVTDDGPGMDRQTQARMFEPFFSTKFTGRGLGLAAVMGIVRGHHGAILVDSTPGRGTRVEVLLPAAPSPVLVTA